MEGSRQMENMPERNKGMRFCSLTETEPSSFLRTLQELKTLHSALFPVLGFCENWIFIINCLLFVRA